MKAVLGPAVARSVAAAASKMQLGQKEELVWHHAVRMSDGNGPGAPVHRHTNAFVNQVRMVAAGGLKIVVWHERKQAVGVSVAISELDCVPVRSEALVTVTSRC